jgi:hypothetical protein
MLKVVSSFPLSSIKVSHASLLLRLERNEYIHRILVASTYLPYCL